LKCFAVCLSVRGFVRPPIGQALSSDPGRDLGDALFVFDAKARTIVVAEIELGKIAVQMLLTNVMERTDNAALENGKIIFSAVLTCTKPPKRTYSSAEWFTVPWPENSLPSLV
jgi:hypothetical protein